MSTFERYSIRLVVSPLASAVMDKAVGDVATVARREVEIIAIA